MNKKQLIKELQHILSISSRYKNCDACALINEKVNKILKSQEETQKIKEDMNYELIEEKYFD